MRLVKYSGSVVDDGDGGDDDDDDDDATVDAAADNMMHRNLGVITSLTPFTSLSRVSTN